MPGRRKRQITTFSLSFLDIMACGFGAVTLLFLVLKHDVEAVETADPNLTAEVNLLREDIRLAEEDLVQLNNSLRKVERQLVETRGLSSRVLRKIDETERELSLLADPEEEIPVLRQKVKILEKQTAELEQSGAGEDIRRFVGDGQRQYLTGLKLDGRRVMILLDVSASMLSDSIVNIIRRRNMDDASKRSAAKWVRAKRAAEWLVAQLPKESQFQIYGFSETAGPILEGTSGQWLDIGDRRQIDKVFAGLEQVAPGGGTSLVHAFMAMDEFERKADNLFLITDGLPTQGEKRPNKATVSGRERAKLFEDAVKMLPGGLPVNVILFPMEGDPKAAAGFWQLALRSRGSFLSPSRDWP